MASKGFISDKNGQRRHHDKPIVLKGASYVEPMGSASVFEDFILDTIAEDVYQVNQSGTPLTAALIDVTAGAPVAGHGGWIGGKTDDVDAEIDEVALGSSTTSGWMVPSRAGNGMLVCEIGFVIPTALTARQYYVGLSDDPSEGTGTNGSLNIQSAYTIVDVATDAAGFIFSSLATAPTIWKFGSTNAGAQSTASAATEGVTGVVDAYTVCRVEVDSSGNAFFYQSIAADATSSRKDPVFVGSLASAVATTALLVPIFTAAPTTTTGVEWEIDYMFGAVAR